tara:strand:- start:259 stop:369 length:111 start_codon:yes stop_codon:yes gene_type:complete
MNDEILEQIYEELLEEGYDDCHETSELAYRLLWERG